MTKFHPISDTGTMNGKVKLKQKGCKQKQAQGITGPKGKREPVEAAGTSELW